jgi:hypothetical protein
MERASLVMRASTDGAGLPTVLKRMVADGGPLTLWRGNGANICQVGPEMAINFMIYDFLKKQVRARQSSAVPVTRKSEVDFRWGSTSPTRQLRPPPKSFCAAPALGQQPVSLLSR